MKKHNFGRIIIANALLFTLASGPIFAAVQTPTMPNIPTVPQTAQVPQVPVGPVAPTNGTSSGDKTKSVSADPSVSTPVADVAASSSAATDPTSQDPGSQTAAVATDPAVSNSTTGADSTNSSVVNPANTNDIKTQNTANVDNTVTGKATSGGNQSSYNTGNGKVKSGNANMLLSLINLVNTSLVTLPGGQFSVLFSQVAGNLLGNYIVDNNTGEVYDMNGSRVSVGNDTTGANSQNNAYVNTGSKTSIDNINKAIVGNNISLVADTGNNSASYNTGDGSVKTGDANVSLNLMNFVNSSLVAGNLGILGVVNVFGNWLGNLVMPNSITGGLGNLSLLVGNNKTGADSSNNSAISANNLLSITNQNLANLVNGVKVAANTGGNTSNFNTGNGTVSTGNAKAEVNVGNVANTNIVGDTAIMMVINVMGSWNGTQMFAPIIIASDNLVPALTSMFAGNNNTGAGSSNYATVDTGSSASITNNNNADINNKINLAANTGNNQSSYNTGSGNVATGNASILANIMNFANLNIVAPKVIFMVMNIFGDWNGTLSDGSVPAPTVSSAISDSHAATAIGNIVVRDLPTTKELQATFEPADPSQDDAVVSTNSATQNDSQKVLAAAIGNDGGPTFFGQTGGVWKYIFGGMLGLYLVAVGISIYRKRMIIESQKRIALMNLTRRTL